MATITRGKTFISGETVEPADMHQLVDSATIAGIVNADIDANAAIAASKLALTGAITDTQLAAGAVTGAAGGGKIAASAITGQTQLADPLASGDEFLVHDTSASALRRVAWSALHPSGAMIKTATSTDAKAGWQNLGAFSVAGPPKTIPLDNTIPQSDEGVEIATVSITPTYSDSIIRLYASISSITSNTGIVAIASLFKDSDPDAFRTAWRYAVATAYHGEMSFMAEHSPATTSSVTYKLRLGPDTAATLYLGGQNTSATSLGDTGKVVLIAQEIKA